MANVLIIDDNKAFCDVLYHAAKRMEHEVTCTHILREGLMVARSGGFDVVFLSAQMPDGNGLDVLPEIMQTPPSPEVVLISDSGNPDEAELAIKSGAWDYINRPSSEKEIALPLVRALQYRAKKVPIEPSVRLKKETFEGIVGNSPQIKACLEVVAQAADSDTSVLITGETGTGKELFAWAIHNNSPRADKNFVVVDCAALPETLVESTLFGHERGAFTGAEKGRDGLITQADRGTLFLDEVGELPFSIQKTFLRVLEELRFRPVGGRGEIKSDFRLIVASNRDLDDMAHRNLFRKDLLFRLRSFTIELPPLRDRTEDIEHIVKHHAAQLCREYGLRRKEFSPEFFHVLLFGYDWPGNVRELVNALERAIISARHEPMLFPRHLPTDIRAKMARTSVVDEDNETQKVNERVYSKETLPGLQELREAAIAEAEKTYLTQLMSLTRGNIKEACQTSGLSRSRLYELFKKHHVSTSG